MPEESQPKAFTDLITRGIVRDPLRILLYGTSGIGKTTFASRAPDPLFVASEDGANNVDVARFPRLETWLDVLAAVRQLRTARLPYQTLVFDTVDWLEPLIAQYICERDASAHRGKERLILADGRPNLSAYGYGREASVMMEEWRVLLADLDRLRRDRGMHVILLGHVGTSRVKNPEGEDYDVIGPKVGKLAAGLLIEWCDTVLYAESRRVTIEPAGDAPGAKAKTIVVPQGDRVMHALDRGAHRAKNRFGMPESLPFGWEPFAAYAFADRDALARTLEEKLALLGDPVAAAKMRAWVAERREDSGAVARALARVDETLAKKAAANGAEREAAS